MVAVSVVELDVQLSHKTGHDERTTGKMSQNAFDSGAHRTGSSATPLQSLSCVVVCVVNVVVPVALVTDDLV